MDEFKNSNKIKYKILCGKNLIECFMYYRILFLCNFLKKGKLEIDRDKLFRYLF